MANRKQRAAIAKETVEILDRESYLCDGRKTSLSEHLEKMRAGTTLYSPAELETLVASLDPIKSSRNPSTITVSNCTTFAAAEKLIDEGFENPLCLNFASAKNPGGGFLSGSQAQEECLARASGLYQSLSSKMSYYEVNRANSSSLYTNHLIYSPSVPVFRDDDDQLSPRPYSVSIVTSPAVNAGAVRKNEEDCVTLIRPTMEERIHSVLAMGRLHGHQAIVLGAWGCGVFANDPNDIASWFANALRRDQRFLNAFDRVVFAVLDFAENAPTFHAFESAFSESV